MEFAAPIVIEGQKVEKDWIDYNGHMNMAFYNVVFDRALDRVFDMLDIGVAYVERENASCFTLQAHTAFLNEVSLDDPLRVDWQLLDYDHKRMHYFESMYHAGTGELVSTCEQMSMHVSMETRRSAPYPDRVLPMLADMLEAHSQLPRPEGAGAVIEIRRR